MRRRPTNSDPRRSKVGFSVIEALIALAIASIGLISIFSLQHQLVDGQRRYEQALGRAELKRNILALLRDLNPADRPLGQVDLPPNERLSWDSQPLSDFRRTTGFPVGDGVFQVRLYRVTAKILDGAGHPLQTITFDRLGWRRPGGPATLDSL